MKITVTLQELFSYALWPIIVIGIIIGCYLIYLITYKIVKVMKHRVPKKNVISEHRIIDKNELKVKYSKELDIIEAEFDSGKITAKTAYQRMSVCIRHFVYEVTGIKVHKYTLSEIRSLQMPVLEELITEFYPPEFSQYSQGNFKVSIEKTKGAIEKWI